MGTLYEISGSTGKIEKPTDVATYFKAEVLITSIPSTISASASDQAISGLTYTITQAGDYIIFAMVSIDISNEDIKPISLVLYKNGSVIANSRVYEYAKKSNDQSLQITYAIDGLVATDVIAVQINNNNEADVTSLATGRILAQSWA